jgi:hypothetical protein
VKQIYAPAWLMVSRTNPQTEKIKMDYKSLASRLATYIANQDGEQFLDSGYFTAAERAAIRPLINRRIPTGNTIEHVGGGGWFDRLLSRL